MSAPNTLAELYNIEPYIEAGLAGHLTQTGMPIYSPQQQILSTRRFGVVLAELGEAVNSVLGSDGKQYENGFECVVTVTLFNERTDKASEFVAYRRFIGIMRSLMQRVNLDAINDSIVPYHINNFSSFRTTYVVNDENLAQDQVELIFNAFVSFGTNTLNTILAS